MQVQLPHNDGKKEHPDPGIVSQDKIRRDNAPLGAKRRYKNSVKNMRMSNNEVNFDVGNSKFGVRY